MKGRHYFLALVLSITQTLGLYFGFYEGIGGAKNLGLFVVWITILVTLPGFFITVKKLELLQALEVFPRLWALLDLAVDLFALGTLIWFGYLWTGALLFICLVIQQSMALAKREHNEKIFNLKEKQSA